MNPPPPPPPSYDRTTWSPATQAIHADDPLNSATDVAPPLHLSTTFRYPSDPSLLHPAGSPSRPPLAPTTPHVYSRISAPNTTRLEAILSSLLSGPALAYTSGLAAFHALLVHLRPRVIAIGQGYHGCHGVVALYVRLTGAAVVDIHDPPSWAGTSSPSSGQPFALGTGDLVHLETPLNPSGEAFDIAAYAALAHARGAWLSVDATFAPPPLLRPFAWGADYVLHSGTKYLGGHSDLLLGVLAANPATAGEAARDALARDRVFLGAVSGNLEAYLGVRSVRTLALRVGRQAGNAETLVRWVAAGLVEGKEGAAGRVLRTAVAEVKHASLQPRTEWLAAQMPNGYAPVFALVLKREEWARALPGRLRAFHHATSLGGVESLIEWRALSDDKVDRRLLRVSVGIEDVRDLWADLVRGLEEVVDEEASSAIEIGSLTVTD